MFNRNRTLSIAYPRLLKSGTILPKTFKLHFMVDDSRERLSFQSPYWLQLFRTGPNSAPGTSQGNQWGTTWAGREWEKNLLHFHSKHRETSKHFPDQLLGQDLTKRIQCDSPSSPCHLPRPCCKFECVQNSSDISKVNIFQVICLTFIIKMLHFTVNSERYGIQIR